MKIPQYDRKQGIGTTKMPAWEGGDRHGAALASLARKVAGLGSVLDISGGDSAPSGQGASIWAGKTRPSPSADDPETAAHLKEDARQVAQAAAEYRNGIVKIAHQSAASGAGGFKRFETAHADILEHMDRELSPTGREVFAALVQPFYAQARKQVLRAEQTARQRDTHSGLASQVLTAKAQVEADPETLPEVLASLDAGYALAAGGGALDKDQARAELAAHRRDLASDALAAKARLDPSLDLAKEAKRPQYAALSLAERKAALRRAAQEAKLAATQREREQDELAWRTQQAFDGEASERFFVSGDEDELMALSDRLGHLGRGQDAAKCRAKLPLMRAGRDLLVDGAGKPFAERLKHVARKAQGKSMAQAAALAKAELDRKVERFRKDPALYVREESAARLAQLSEQGADMERPEHAPLRVSLDLQLGKGRGLEGFLPRLLTREQQGALAWGFASATGVEQSLELAHRLAKSAGPLAGQAAREARLPLAVQLGAELTAESPHNIGVVKQLLRAQALERPLTAQESAVASKATQALARSPVFKAMLQAYALVHGQDAAQDRDQRRAGDQEPDEALERGGAQWREAMEGLGNLLAKASALAGSPMFGRAVLERAFSVVSDPDLGHVVLPGEHDPERLRRAAKELLSQARRDHGEVPEHAVLASTGPGWDQLALVAPPKAGQGAPRVYSSRVPLWDLLDLAQQRPDQVPAADDDLLPHQHEQQEQHGFSRQSRAS